MIIGINTRLLLAYRMEGIARFTWEITKRMIEAHPEDEFILFFDRPFDASFLTSKNVKGVVIAPQSRHPILWKIWFEFSLKRAAIKHKIDVLFMPDGFASLGLKIPQLLVIHDLTYIHFPDSMKRGHLSFYAKMMPKYYNHAKQVVTVSEFTRMDVEREFGKHSQEIEIVYNALTKTNLESNQSLLDFPYFLYLGSIHPRKNIVRLIEAYQEFRNQNPDRKEKLVLAGRKAFGNEDLDEALSINEYRDDIVFMGVVSEEEKYQLLLHAAVFIYISLFEGFGIPLLEAMSTKTPIITSNQGALNEVNQDLGLSVSPTDTIEIAKMMKKALIDKNFRTRFKDNCAIRLSNFSWDKSADKIYDNLEKLSQSN